MDDYKDLVLRTCKTHWTAASEQILVAVLGHTLGRVLARIGAAGVHLEVTVLSSVWNITMAQVVINLVDAFPMHTWIVGTFIDVCLTSDSCNVTQEHCFNFP